MRCLRIFLVCLLSSSAASVVLSAEANRSEPKVPHAWRQTRTLGTESGLSFPRSIQSAGSTAYTIGDPTSEEQLILEWINRARANPAAEGERLREATDLQIIKSYVSLEVNLDLMVSQFKAIAFAPPLAMNAKLVEAARRHSRDMLTVPQGHIGSDGSTPGTRVTEAGYLWTFVGENVYSGAESIWHGHAAFQVDWGGDASTGGMQTPPGHREAIHDPDFREVGIGVLHASSDIAGPVIITQDFATGRNSAPFITGVAYYDANANNFYDVGEGIEGVRISAPGATAPAITAGSGGYALPVSGNGVYTVTFDLPGVTPFQRTVTISNRANAKIDFVPAYQPTGIDGPSTGGVNRSTRFTVSPLAGAKEFHWRFARRVPMTVPEGAEAGLTKVTAIVSPGYDVADGAIKASGAFSFHLAQPEEDDQILTLERSFQAGANSELRFRSRLGWASTSQVARAQISTDGWQTWRDVWTQAGTGGMGERSFAARSISLRDFAGEEIQVRFLYGLIHRRYFNQTDPGVGFYVDDILVANADELVDPVTGTAGADRSFTVQPTQPGEFALRARAKTGRDPLPWGPFKFLTATASTGPELTMTAIRSLGSGQIQIEFTASGVTTGTVRLESAPSLDGPWLNETPVSLENLGTVSRATLARPSTAPRFYRTRLD